jgi:prepilin-type N-terminal cleavage/methylation domain-containing protein
MNDRARGFTLVELMVAVAVFVIVSAAAFVFAKSQIVARKQTQQLLDTEQNARVALDSIRLDLQSSGLGVGYSLNGVFSGITMGRFGTFDSNDHVHPNTEVSDDLRIRGATGPVRTIASYNAPNVNGTMEVCTGGGFQVGDLVLIVTESYTQARAIEIIAPGPTPPPLNPCTESDCISGCDVLNFIDRSARYETDGNARFASYQGGSAFRGFVDVTYFVEWNGTEPALYRGEQCASRAACAIPDNLLGEGVESLQARIFELDPAAAAPTDVTADPTYAAAGGVDSLNRLRVDVEVIARSRTPEPDAPLSKECSAINTTLPTACYPQGAPDRFRRRKLMTSVELKNSGHMRFQALR